MRWRVAALGTAGVALTLLGAVFVFLPGLVEWIGPVAAVAGVLGGVDPSLIMLLATVVFGLYVAVAARSSTGQTGSRSAPERRYERAASTPPEAVTADRRQRTGATLDADVRRAVESGGQSLLAVREMLEETATSVCAEHAGLDRARAREAVAAGTWTDDRVASAFLAGEDGPTPSVLARVRLWLVPERERERRIERTVAAIASLREER